MSYVDKVIKDNVSYPIQDTEARARLDKEILYFYQQGVSAATNAEILRITDSRITADTVLLNITFGTPANITSGVAWHSYTGYIAFTGTCTAATTADVVLGQKGN